MEKISGTASFEKETANAIRFKEDVEVGTPDSFKQLYLPKWLVGDVRQVKVTIEPANSK